MLISAPANDQEQDPVASATRWLPLQERGFKPNFDSHALDINGTRMVLRRKWGPLLLVMSIILLGIYTLLLLPYGDALPGGSKIWLCASALAGAAACAVIAAKTRWVVDTAQGRYLFGMSADSSGRQQGPVSDIHALQIVPTYRWARIDAAEDMPHGKTYSIRGYELNLVFKNSRRINVAVYTHYDRLELHAGRIASALGIPVWHSVPGQDRQWMESWKSPNPVMPS